MAIKTLKTRIVNKHDELATWNSSDLILKKGEIAIAMIKTATGGNYSVPTCMMKVGDGVSEFSALNWVAAPAADVYTWAKKENPTIDELPANLKKAITDLQAAIGAGGSVADSIAAAIANLDKADTAVAKQFVTAVAEEDGIISVTRRALTADDIPTLAVSKITGLQDALDGKADAADVTKNTEDIAANTAAISAEVTAREATDANVAKVKTTADAALPKATYDTFIKTVNADAIADAKKAGTDAKAAIESYQKSNDKALADETAARTTGDATNAENITAVGKRVTALEGTITGLSGAMHFKGVVAKLPTDLSSYNAGDVVIVDKKEYVCAGEGATKAWHELGDEGSHLIKTEAAKIYVAKTDYNAKVATIDNSISTINTELDKKALASDLITLEGKVTTNTGDISKLKTAVGSSASGLVKDVADLKTTVGDASGGLVKRMSAAEATITAHTTSINNKVDKVEGKGLSTNDYTTTEKNKLNGIATGAQVNVIEEIQLDGTKVTPTSKVVNLAGLAKNTTVTAVVDRVTAIENDYLKGVDELVLDCGTSALNIFE